MTKEINNPYVATYSKYSPNSGWSVLFRYLIGEKLKFSFVANTKDGKTAKKLARLCNKDWRLNNGKEDPTDEV